MSFFLYPPLQLSQFDLIHCALFPPPRGVRYSPMPSSYATNSELGFIYLLILSGIIRLYWTLCFFFFFLANIGLGSFFSVALRRQLLSFALRSLRDVRRLSATLLQHLQIWLTCAIYE